RRSLHARSPRRQARTGSTTKRRADRLRQARMRLSLRLAAALAAVLALAGCGIPNPGATTTPRPAAAPAPSGARPAAVVLDPRRDPLVRLAVEFALTQATWSPASYVRGRARLAQI